MTKYMKILVTGATGLLGSRIIANLVCENGCFVIAYTTNFEKAKKKFENLNIRILAGEELDTFDLNEVDIILNCAYPMNKKGKELVEGLRFIMFVMKKAADSSVRGVINISSQSVYGNTRSESADETDNCSPEDMYALGKYMVEELSEAYLRSIPHINIRMASLLAPELNARFVNKFVMNVIRGEPITVTRGIQHIQFLDVRDAANAISTICTKWDFSFSGVLNVGGDEAYSLMEYAEIVNSVAEKFNIPSLPIKINAMVSNKNTMMKSDKMEKLFAWRPKYSIAETVTTIYDSILHLNKVGGGRSLKQIYFPIKSGTLPGGRLHEECVNYWCNRYNRKAIAENSPFRVR